ncbi:MAG: acyl-CoA dehydrogenase C-terminal domain-containing protein [Deltaproteobacteria bacterium]|nr:acyl-CoA dehydrogenase C-terminal domain-containing protein [Deltaproteobacteria bacterium]
MKDPNAPRVPIVEHPDVRRMLMEMRAMSEGIRALVYHAARLHSLAEYTEDEAEHQRASDRLEFLTPIVKAYPTDRGFEIATMAIQVLGGVGYCREYGVEQYCRDAKISSIYEGTNGVQALDLVGRKMTMKGGRLFMTFMTELSAFIDEATGHEALGGLAADLGAARDKVANIAMQFMQQAGTDPIFPVLSATPFLEALGHVIVSKLLLEQAHIAYAKQKALMAEKGVTDEEAFAKDNDDAAFYYNKKLTARFFIKNILPRVDAIAARIQTRDESCLKAIF